jgi:predicted peroxiredoxin
MHDAKTGGWIMTKKEKLLIMCTHGPEDAERATIAFVMATAAQASEVEVLVGLQADGGLLAKKGIAEGVSAAAFPPLKQLLDTYLEAGGKLFVCGPCVKSRQIDPETDFVPGASVVNAATFIKEATEATNVLIY